MKKSNEKVLVNRLGDLLKFCNTLREDHSKGIEELKSLQATLKAKKDTFKGEDLDELVDLTKNTVLEMRNVNLNNNLLFESIKNSSAKLSELYNVLSIVGSDLGELEDQKDVFKAIQGDTKDIYSMKGDGLGELDSEVAKAIKKPLEDPNYLDSLTRRTLEQLK